MRVAGEHVPQPFRHFVIKVHSRCDLACDHCFVYTKADQRWSSRPHVMADATVAQVARRIGEHAAAHGLDRVTVVLHGGEPLLAGVRFLERAVGAVRSAVAAPTVVDVVMQTNAVLLTPQTLAVLRDLGVRVGVSLDGDRTANDRHRRRHDGGSSYLRVVAALEELARPGNREVYAGILCTVDLENDPVATYEALLRHRPPRVDLLLPVANWSAPPPRPVPGSPTPYGDWLSAVFDRWYRAPVLETRMRYFEDVMGLLLGGRARGASAGTAPAASVVVETDGAVEVCDALTAAYPGAGATGLSVATDPFDAALRSPLVVQRQSGLAGLGATCRRCSLVAVCGGGSYEQRFRSGEGFGHPSVYCRDLFAVITNIRSALAADVERLLGGAPDGGTSRSPAGTGPGAPSPAPTAP